MVMMALRSSSHGSGVGVQWPRRVMGPGKAGHAGVLGDWSHSIARCHGAGLRNSLLSQRSDVLKPPPCYAIVREDQAMNTISPPPRRCRDRRRPGLPGRAHDAQRRAAPTAQPWRGHDHGPHHARCRGLLPKPPRRSSRLVALCHQHGVPVVAFGAGTSLEGHVNPVRGGISLDLSRMNRVLDVSAPDLDCLIEPGVTRQQLNEYLRDQGMFFPVDPGSHCHHRRHVRDPRLRHQCRALRHHPRECAVDGGRAGGWPRSSRSARAPARRPMAMT